MVKIGLPEIPTRSLAYIAVCLGGLLAFVFISILPTQKSLAGLDEDIADLKVRIEEQKILAPVYKDLLQEFNADDAKSLPFPEQTELRREKIDTITSVFDEIARRNKLRVGQIIPDFNSITEESGLVLVNAIVRGNFQNFREFLVEMGGISYLSGIDEIQILAEPGEKIFKLRFSLALGGQT